MANGSKILEVAQSLLPQIRALVDAKCAELGASADFGKKLASEKSNKELHASGDAKAYFEASNTVLRAVVACAVQRAMDDGAKPRQVSRRLNSTDGFELFLSTHPALAEKIAAEKAAKEAAYKAQQLANDYDSSDVDPSEDGEDNEE